MFGSDDEKNYDAASGRPVMRDIKAKVKSKRRDTAPSPLRKEEKETEEIVSLPVLPKKKKEKSSSRKQTKESFLSSAGWSHQQEQRGSPLSGAPKKIVGVKTSRGALYWSTGSVAAFTAALMLINFLSYAVLKITPRQEFVEVDSSLKASLNSQNDLALDLINLENIREASADVSGSKRIAERARGVVVIFNAFDTEPQVLVASTRLEAPNGNIYRIPERVIVPGARIENGKMVPQGVEATAIADAPGEKHNLGLSDFTIPGFKGSPRYDKFYARSKTEMQGGFEGEGKVIGPEDVSALVSKLQNELAESFQSKILSDLPPGVVLPQGSFNVSFDIENVNPPVNSRGDRVSVRVKGSFEGLALKEEDISRALGKSYLGLEPGENVSIANLDALSKEVLSKSFENRTMTLKVKGRAHFVWEFDEEALVGDLAVSRSDLKDVFAKYKEIERAEIEFKPPWWRVFPKDPSDIRISKVISE